MSVSSHRTSQSSVTMHVSASVTTTGLERAGKSQGLSLQTTGRIRRSPRTKSALVGTAAIVFIVVLLPQMAQCSEEVTVTFSHRVRNTLSIKDENGQVYVSMIHASDTRPLRKLKEMDRENERMYILRIKDDENLEYHHIFSRFDNQYETFPLTVTFGTKAALQKAALQVWIKDSGIQGLLDKSDFLRTHLENHELSDELLQKAQKKMNWKLGQYPIYSKDDSTKAEATNLALEIAMMMALREEWEEKQAQELTDNFNSPKDISPMQELQLMAFVDKQNRTQIKWEKIKDQLKERYDQIMNPLLTRAEYTYKNTTIRDQNFLKWSIVPIED